MERETFDATIRSFKDRVPFRVFTVALANGTRVEIDHPSALVIRDGVALFAGPGGVPHVFDFEGVKEVIGELAGNQSR